MTSAQAARISLSAVAALAALGAAPAALRAQGVEPGGGATGEPGVGPYAAPAPRLSAPAGDGAGADSPTPASGGGEAGGGDEAAAGYYHTDDYATDLDVPTSVAAGGPVPNVHVVRRGDTLWDLCFQYFNSPWEWPKVWSYNPEITNPHWIYPGDQVRLRVAGSSPEVAAAGADAGAPAEGGGAGRAPLRDDQGFALRQIAFVDLDDLRFAGRVEGSPEEKVMLARGDEAYLTYPAGRPPKAGKRYSIYQKKRDVKHPETGKVIGAYVRVVGELEVVSVKKDKRARALIIDSVDVIERGWLVGPLKQRFTSVEQTPATVDLQGTIVGLLGADELIGARQVVFVDKGVASGLKVGNRLYAVRRGDAYEPVMGPSSNIGKDDRRYPARALGELLVVEVGKHTSLAVVTLAVQELGIGDHVVLSRATN